MTKSKSGRALFDLLSDEAEEISDLLKQDARWSPGDREVAADAPETTGPPKENGFRLVDPGPEEAPSLLVLDGRKLKVSLTPLTGAAAAFVLLLVLASAFAAGKRSGRSDGLRDGFEQGRASYADEALSDIQVARAQPAATHLVDDLMAQPGKARPEPKPANATADRPEWLTGYTYVVAQEFSSRHADDAAGARAFLEKRGIATAVVRRASGSVQLITTQGYNHKDPTQKRMASELLKKLHAAGASYYRAGGGYKLEGYFKTLKGEHW